jgi:hypothetical protein
MQCIMYKVDLQTRQLLQQYEYSITVLRRLYTLTIDFNTSAHSTAS